MGQVRFAGGVERIKKVWWWASDAIRFVVPVFLGVRIGLSAFAALVLYLFPPVSVPAEYWRGLDPVVDGLRGWLLGPWQRWDALWYLQIASKGYRIGDGSTAFFPLYPLLISLVSMGLRTSHLFSALLISNVAGLAAVILLYQITCLELGPQSAKYASVYQLFFPTAFFLFAPYAESLFLFWVLACFYAARTKRWWLAGIMGFFAALTRLPGVLLAVPLVWEWWRQNRSWRQNWSQRPNLPPGKWFKPQVLALGLIPLGLVVYGAYLAARFRNPLLWLNSHSQSQWSRSLAWPWETIGQIWSSLFQPVNNAIDLLFFLLFVFLAVWAFKKLPKMYSLYMFGLLALPLFNPSVGAPLYSMPRFVLILFPGFMVLGQAGQHRVWHRIILYVFLLCLTFFTAMFVNWFWVA